MPEYEYFEGLPLVLQQIIMESVSKSASLRQLARIATLGRGYRALYLERVAKRDAEVAILLTLNFDANFRRGLTHETTSLPRDLIVASQINPLLQADPQGCRLLKRYFRDRGERYRGFCRAGRADGHGRWIKEEEPTLLETPTYEGDWSEGWYHGHGTRIWPNGDTYVGEWQEGLCHGRGIFRFGDGDVYDGEWHLNNRHGVGTYRWRTGEVYSGQISDGMAHGQGNEKYLCKARYEGEFRFGERHGRGSMIYPDKWKCTGLWVDGELVQEKSRVLLQRLPRMRFW